MKGERKIERRKERKEERKEGKNSDTVEAIIQLDLFPIFFLNEFLHILCNNRIYNYASILSQPRFKQISPLIVKKEPRRHEFVASFA